MSRHFNSVTLIGNLTKAPELRYTPSDTAVANFGLAINRSYQDNDGEWQEETDFVDITVWAREAENASEYLDKGDRAFIDGRLNQETWEADDGSRRSKVSVTANNIIYLENGQADAEDVLDEFDVEEDESDIPF